MKYLANQHALITGGSRGLGFAIAKRLAEQGCRITLLSRNRDTLAQSARILNEKWPHTVDKHSWVSCDLSKPEGLADRITRELGKDLGNVSTLVNCAGQTQSRLLVTSRDAEMQSVFNVNLVSPTILSRLVSRAMLRLKPENPNILNVSSILSQHYLPGTTAYSSSKAALNKFTLNLAREFDPSRCDIRVNVLLPGLIRETEIGESVNVSKMKQYGLESLTTTTEDVADAALAIVNSTRTGEMATIVTDH